MPTDDDDQTIDEPDSKGMRQLRQRAEQASELEKELALTKREMVFTKAGIDTSVGLGKMFFKSYEGDATDVEAIKAEATELGIIKIAGSEQTQQTPKDDEAQAAFRKTIPSGGQPSGGVDAPKIPAPERALAAFHAARKNGAREQDAHLEAFDMLFHAAQQGDPTAIFDKQAWAAKTRS